MTGVVIATLGFVTAFTSVFLHERKYPELNLKRTSPTVLFVSAYKDDSLEDLKTRKRYAWAIMYGVSCYIFLMIKVVEEVTK